MAQYRREGLNFVPLLAQNISPPCSGRSRISLSQKRTTASLVCYNGNYEGDNSMFKDKGFELERLSLVDTESDTEFQIESSKRSNIELKSNYERSSSLAWRVLELLMLRFLKPESREKISHKIEYFMESHLYKKFTKGAKFITVVLTYICYISLILWKRLTDVCHFSYKSRVIFRNLVRRLLWWLTLAKCSDFTLFVLILFSIPVLFILALLGFIVSTCGGIKDALHYWGII